MSRLNQRLIVIVVIVALALLVDIPKNPRIKFLGIDKTIQTRLGLDLVGGVQALLEADVPATTALDVNAMDAAVTIVENRVNGLGVNEAVVQKAGERRIVVELPGETDPEAALAAIKQTGLLEFVDFTKLTDQEIFLLMSNNEVIQTDSALGTVTLPVPTPTPVQPTSVVSPTQVVSPTLVISPTTPAPAATIYHTVMTGKDLKTVQVETNPSTGQYEVAFSLYPEGAQIFKDFTTANVGKTLAIVLDRHIISAPNINNAITDGAGLITGSFTLDSANTLAVQLRYGSLPIPLRVVERRTVGPTLGQDSLRKSFLAGVIGFSVVVLFMAIYYRVPGLLADVTILIYALIAFALYRFIPVTLTLPGIAGFLLSTGSALDANILIFERFKEELRSGKSLMNAADLGWKRAWPSIRDSNFATIITCTILYWFGSAFGATIVKGFSLTLAFGVIVSLFTAIFVTRTLLTLVLDYFKPTNYSKWFGI